jgi:type IV pilus assembly protein PilY1
LLDGAPIAKDVIFDRDLTTPQGKSPTNWHTMLVAGFGSQGRGYYAVDVTDPDATKMPSGGPTFRWQLTHMPSSDIEIFGAHAGTPAITSLFFDPGDGNGTREIGVAILPGGSETGPSSGMAGGPPCARAPKLSDATAPLGLGSGYRSNVRCWGANQKWTDPVVGRSLTIVRLDTGEIIRTFMRLADAPITDKLKLAGRITDTPLDSPMTGVPMIYPGDVGSPATKLFIGDADGTIWKFDISNSDPKQWVAEIFLDPYMLDNSNPQAWAEGQGIQVPPVLSLDNAGSLVLNFGTGDQETYTNVGLNYMFSVSEKVQSSPPKLRAQVNWYLPLLDGERVSGPMTVFDRVFYFSTFAASSQSQSCTAGIGRIWGRDFVTPDDKNDLSKGGLRILQPPPPSPPQNPPPLYIQPSDYDPTLLGKVIPGVSIMATPACSSLSSGAPDQYIAGASHQSIQNMSPASYSLFTQVGGKNTSNNSGSNVATFQQQVPTPMTPTVIDSWAGIIE